jgi:hypothetical protein
MTKHYLENKWLRVMLFLSTVCICLNINLGKESNHKALAYEPHEFVFISGLENLGVRAGAGTRDQEFANSTCKDNFSDLRGQGIFDENVGRNTWHIWAHLDNRHCVMNIRNWSGRDSYVDWTPSNNRNRKIPVRVPIFN